MKPIILLLGVLFLLVSLVFLEDWENPYGVQDNGDSKRPEIVEPPSTMKPSETGVLREPIGAPEESSITWRDQLHLMPEFQRIFSEIYVVEGGEQFAKEYVAMRTREMRELGKLRPVKSALEQLKAFNMAFNEQSFALFEDVVWAEHFHIAGLLSQQQQNWRKWKKSLDEGHLRNFPLDRVAKYPLNFPPELHLALMTGGQSSQSLPTEILVQAAGIRDRFVRDAGAIELERYLMLGAIQQTERASSMSIPASEWEEAMCVLLPPYLGVREGQESIERSYMNELQALLIENGYEISVD
jgi:hypothetical protein